MAGFFVALMMGRPDRLRLGVKRITRGSHGADGIALLMLVKRLAKPANVNVDGPHFYKNIRTPNRIQELLS